MNWNKSTLLLMLSILIIGTSNTIITNHQNSNSNQIPVLTKNNLVDTRKSLTSMFTLLINLKRMFMLVWKVI